MNHFAHITIFAKMTIDNVALLLFIIIHIGVYHVLEYQKDRNYLLKMKMLFCAIFYGV